MNKYIGIAVGLGLVAGFFVALSQNKFPRSKYNIEHLSVAVAQAQKKSLPLIFVFAEPCYN